MSNVANKYKIGMLVLGAIALLIASLLSLGVLKYFRKTYHFMTVVESSVQGLEKGAKVKFKGVPIGSVSHIQITPKHNTIYIFMDFDPNAFVKTASDYADKEKIGKHSESFFKSTLEEEVLEGLRCQLQLAGITGSLYVDISYYDPEKYPVKEYKLPEDHPPYLPSIPSVSISNILEEIQTSVVKISKIDFVKISEKIDDFLNTANTLIKDKSIKLTVENLKRIGDNLDVLTSTLNETLTKENIDQFRDKFETTLRNVDQTLTEIKKLVQNADDKINQSDVPGTVKAAKSFLVQGEKTAKKAENLEVDMKATLTKVNQALFAMREFLDYLEKNPSALIRGKAAKPIVEP